MPYDGVAFERGPLVFSLNVKAQEEITETRELDGIKFQSRILTLCLNGIMHRWIQKISR